MKKIIIALAIVMAVSLNIRSEGLTPTEDKNLRHAFLRMEDGTETFTTETQEFYKKNPLHYIKNYYNHTPAPRLELRTEHSANAIIQIEYATQVKKHLENIAEHEGMKLLSRQSTFNHEKYVEGKKINKRCDELSKLIQQLSRYGGDTDEWEMRLNMYKTTAPQLIEQSYMPIGDRKDAYVSLYNEITQAVDELQNQVSVMYYKQELGKYNDRDYKIVRGKAKYVAGDCLSNLLSAATTVNLYEDDDSNNILDK